MLEVFFFTTAYLDLAKILTVNLVCLFSLSLCLLHLQVVPETLEPSLQLAAAVLAQVTIMLFEQIYCPNELFNVLAFYYYSHLMITTPFIVVKYYVRFLL